MPVLLALVVLLLVGGGYLVLTVSDLKSQVSDLKGQTQADSERLQQVAGQIKVTDDAEKQLALRLDAQAKADPVAIAKTVQPSVWTIATERMLGSGWVVSRMPRRRPSSPTSTSSPTPSPTGRTR